MKEAAPGCSSINLQDKHETRLRQCVSIFLCLSRVPYGGVAAKLGERVLAFAWFDLSTAGNAFGGQILEAVCANVLADFWKRGIITQ